MAASAKQVLLWTRQRTMTRTNANREVASLQRLISAAPADLSAIRISKKKLQNYRQRLAELDGLILPHVEDDQIDDTLSETDQEEQKLTSAIVTAEEEIDRADREQARANAVAQVQANIAAQAASAQANAQATSAAVKTAKLPELQLVKFYGDTLQFQTFWDTFEAVVHSKPMSAVEKFQYLKNSLGGEAARLVEGYTPTDASYNTVRAALKERYDNKDLCIFAHLDAMISMKPASADVADLQRVYDQCEAHIRGLVVLGMQEVTFGKVFTPLILSKMPRFIRVELYRTNGDQTWTLDNLRKHLKGEILARQLGAHVLSNTGSDHGAKGSESQTQKRQATWRRSDNAATGASLVASGDSKDKYGKASEPKQCLLCQQFGHVADNCERYTTAGSRIAALGSRCRMCFAKGHFVKTCNRKRKCRKCGDYGTHHHSLCLKNSSQPNKPTDSALNVSAHQVSPATAVISDMNARHGRGQAVMPTAVTTVKGIRATRKARVVLDTASTQSFARADLLKAIGARKIRTDYLGLAGVQAESRKVAPYGCYELTLILDAGSEMNVTVHSLKTISCPIKKPAINLEKYPLLKQLQLAEPLSDKEEELQLDIMIGLDHYYQLVGPEQVRLDDSLVLLGTRFGYVVTGSVSAEHGGDTKCRDTTLIVTAHDDRQLDDDLQRLWRLEDVGWRDDVITTEDDIAKQKFIQSIQYDTDERRYSVRWPWKIDRPDLPDNFGIAHGRLKSLLKRLDADSLNQYNEVIESQIAAGVVETAPAKPTGPLVHYVPHHCVIRPDKATTKLRVVYDASCKASKRELSLNECIYRGPVLLADLCGLLLRFRTHRIGLISDIEKAFLQVGLQAVDRDVTRFLWLKDVRKPLTADNLLVLRFARVLFGVIASPYMLDGTIEVHMNRVNTPVAKQILRDNYVDNEITGASSTGEALAFYEQAKTAFKSASMNLREWFSNDKGTMERIPESDRGKGELTTVLGLEWNIQTDQLRFKVKLSESTSGATKREMLKAVASVFDPLGVLAPITIRAKILLQKVWEQGSAWDESVGDEVQRMWNQLLPELSLCSSISFPRLCVKWSKAALQLHCFCDASKDAFGAVTYLRAEAQGQVNTAIVFAKARVCPLKDKNMTIPRLELTAAALGSRIMKFVQTELHLGELQLYLWTDSMCTYHWIGGSAAGKSGKRPVFVKNRVQDILAKKPFELRYVPTACNPADLLTRGLSSEELRTCHKWWHGPDFLNQDPSVWPPTPAVQADDERSDIVQEFALQTSAQASSDADRGRLDPCRFSSLTRLVRVTAWVYRFVNNARHRGRTKATHLSTDETESALRIWLRLSQQDMAKNNPAELAKVTRQLLLFADAHGILRSRGRIETADLPYDERFPVFVPKNCRLARLLIADAHGQTSHAGVAHTLAALRERFWIPRGRSGVSRVIKSCMGCKRFRGGAYNTPRPPPLPDFRVDYNASFDCVGLDYLGPLHVRQPRTKASEKCWICLFTCASTRAIHLEVISDMTTEHFLLALRRFSALYGFPRVFVSDNARQFKMSEKVLNRLAKDILETPDVQAVFANHGIRWKYIVELAPWMGGMYERMVGIAKKALRCAIQRQVLSLVELQTVCAEVCAVVNTRPLTYVTDATRDRVLRPCDLISVKRKNFPPVDTSDLHDQDFWPVCSKQADLVRHWKRIENRVKTFWDTWHRDYLLAIRERNWKHTNRGASQTNPKVGAVVLVHKEYAPRATWRIGRIEELIRSDDGHVRSARVKLPDGNTLQRPMKLLFPMEVEVEEAPGQQAVSPVRNWGLESSDSESEQ